MTLAFTLAVIEVVDVVAEDVEVIIAAISVNKTYKFWCWHNICRFPTNSF